MPLCLTCPGDDVTVLYPADVGVRIISGNVESVDVLGTTKHEPHQVFCNDCQRFSNPDLNVKPHRVLSRLLRMLGLQDINTRIWSAPSDAERAAIISADGMLDATAATELEQSA